MATLNTEKEARRQKIRENKRGSGESTVDEQPAKKPKIDDTVEEIKEN